MLGELGHFSLILALVGALYQAAAGLSPLGPVRLHRAAIDLHAVCLVAAFAALTVAFLQNDFTLVYVVQHSNRDLPWAYRMAAVWGGHEGSMLLWTLILVGWTVLAERSLALRDVRHARYLAGVLGKRREGVQIYYRIVNDRVVTLCRAVCVQIAIEAEQSSNAGRG